MNILWYNTDMNSTLKKERGNNMKELLQQVEYRFNTQQQDISTLNKRIDSLVEDEYKARQKAEYLCKQAYIIRQKVKRIQKLIDNNVEVAQTLLQEVNKELASIYVGN